jgi:Clostripain family
MSARKPWTVLAYTVADDQSGGDSLDDSAQQELKAVCDAADFGRVSIAAQVDFVEPKGVFRGTITAAPPKSRAFAPVRAKDHPLWKAILGEVDEQRSVLTVQREAKDLSAARAGVLRQFFRFGQSKAPAERYVIYFYGHAYGPMGLFCDAESGQRHTDTLRLNDLATSVSTTDGRAAVLIFRDCFMNTLETAYQLKDTAEFMIATQALAPIAGVWPWAKVMAALAPEATSYDVGLSIVQELAAFLDEPANRDPFADVPLALLDLGAAEAFARPLAALTDALEAARADRTLARACAKAMEGARMGSPEDHERPGDPALIDVPTMCARLQKVKDDKDDGVARRAATLGDVVRDQLVRWHRAQQKRFTGTSLFYKPAKPADVKRSYLQAEDEATAAADAAHYATLALCEATGWHRVALNPFPA